ncbi:unnamed protein product [Prorocentrum cordatum]|uniref:Uncharacterized protein n=1 Tax=Prorocentrum cordatum TaxID=2364126 RepID=A0ABN9XYY3_9DINO|nr:unnamed protein product [Polarella glacialis]
MAIIVSSEGSSDCEAREQEPLSYVPYWLECSVLDRHEAHIDMKYKAYVYDDGGAAWSLRGMFEPLVPERARRVNVHREVKQQRLPLEVFMYQLGIDFDSEYFPSIRQVVAKDDGGDSIRFTNREEPTVSTLGFLIWQVWWATGRRRKVEQGRAADMLVGFLGRCWRGKLFDDAVVRAVLDGVGHECPRRRPDRSCDHLAPIIASRVNIGRVTLHGLTELLVALASHYLHCPAASRAVKAICQHLASTINAALGDMGLDTDRLKHATRADRTARRPRADEDYKKALTERIAKKRRCHGKAGVVDLAGFGASAPKHWDHQEMMAYQKAAYRTLGVASGVFCLQGDGARLGQPAKEHLHMVLQHNSSDLACVLPPQAAPDWRGQGVLRGKMTTLQKQLWIRRCHDFLHAKRKQDMEGKASLQKDRVANAHYLELVDHGLQAGVGFGLSKFKVDGLAARALLRSEMRYFIDILCLPAHMQASAHGRTRRSCIVDRSTQATRLEVCWDIEKPVLISFLDQGSVGWNCNHWLFTGRCRGWAFCDPSHRRHDSCMNAVEEAGLSFVKYEALLIENLGKGPWKQQSNFGKFSEAAAEYFNNVDESDELFLAVLPWMAFRFYEGESGQSFDGDFAKWMWKKAKTCELFQNSGASSRKNRWFQWTRRWRDISNNVGFLLVALLYEGLNLGWWATLGDSPFKRLAGPRPEDHGGSAGAPGNAGGPLADAAGTAVAPAAAAGSGGGPHVGHGAGLDPGELEADRSRGVAASNAGLDRWANRRNAQQVAADILCNPPVLTLADMVSFLSEPIDDESGVTLTMLKTRRGCLEWHARMASNRVDHLFQVWARVGDPKLLAKLGVTSAAGPAASERRYILQSMWDLTRAMIGNELEYIGTFSQWLPGKFAGLISHDLAVKGEAIEFCKKSFLALEVAEHAAFDEPALQQWLRQLVWVKQPWVREVLVSLAETNWTDVPSDVEEQLMSVFSGPGGTKDVEDIFNVVRRCTAKTSTGGLRSATQWYRASHAQVLEETGKKQPEVKPIDRIRNSGKLPASMFKGSACEFSLEDAALSEYKEGKWGPAPSPQNWLLVPLAHHALLWAEGDATKLLNTWLSCLAVKGTVLCKWGDPLGDEALLVMKVGPHGAYCWKASARSVDGETFLTPKLHPDAVEIVHIHSLTTWAVFTVGPVTASDMLVRFGGQVFALGISKALLRVKDEKPWTVLEASAIDGFRSLTTEHMSKLCRHLGIRNDSGSMPTTEAELAKLLVRRVLHWLDDSEVEDILSQRKKT